MIGLKSLLKKAWPATDACKHAEQAEHLAIADSLLAEVDYQIKELESMHREQDAERRRQETGVDYSWLVSVMPKTYDIPQLERLELEELCYKVNKVECGKIIALFRDAMIREHPVNEIARIMRSCVLQVIEHRPHEESMMEWMAKRTMSLSNLRIRISPRVEPTAGSDGIEDVEMQNTQHREHRAMSVPDFSVTRLPV
ncbi:protein RD3-like [Gigantopelta aegis]|uniref:protein RD3-like n=1 Tax=Gigantopelta aegis TaxID=1735272 RepID=UPI001B88C04F|nr:protein RD3-like [Gigantopelta aegis]